MNADERRRVVLDWNATRSAYPADEGVAQLFEQQVDRTPDAIALRDGATTLTYAELDRQANRLARRLRSRGVERGTLVATLTPRSPLLVVALLAVLKAGGAYVPIDVGYPRNRLADMLDDAEPRVVLGSSHVLDGVDAFRDRLLPLDDPRAWQDESSERLAPSAGGRDLAYVMFTSGSTGRPKGACIEQRSIARLVLGTRYVAFGPQHRIAQASNASFDAATFEIWGALLNGGSLVMLDKDTVIDAARLADAIATLDITTMFLTAALFNQIADLRPETFRGLTDLIVGGDQVSARAVRRIAPYAPARLLNGYGPTETTTFATTYLIRDVAPDATSVPIGAPIANTTVYVLDPDMEPCAVGAPGELYIGGPGCARGYWRRASITAEKFVPDPFSTEPGARLYRTGDRVQWTPDGNLAFLGRVDHQVKVRGFRIELGEIEAALAACAGVRDLVVVVRERTPTDKSIVAYFTHDAGGAADIASLRAELARTLPDYMMPSAFVVLDSLPLTPNGKVDRKALPAPTRASTRELVEPSSEIELAIALAFADVVHVERVGALDDFLELGGDSLSATRLAAGLVARLGKPLTVRTIFEARTPRAIAAALEAAGGAAPAPIPRLDRAARLPLSSQEEGLWFLHRLDPTSATYNECAAFRVRGPLHYPVLVRAFARLADRHEALRTRYVEGVAGPSRIIDPPGDAVSVARLAAKDAGGAAKALRELSVRAYDFEREHMWRAAVVDIGDGDRVVAMAMHHIITDEWSIHLLFRDLGQLYASERDRAPSSLPERAVEYADWAASTRSLERATALAEDAAHFVARLAGTTAVEMPADHARPARPSGRGGRIRSRMDAAFGDLVAKFAREEGTSVSVVLLAVFAALVHRHAGCERFAIGMPVAGRTRRELEDVAGFFVNTVAIDFDLSGSPTMRGLVRRTKDAVLEALAHAEAPLDRIVDALGGARDPSRSPVFQIMFAPQPREAEVRELGGSPASRFDVDTDVAKFDLTLNTVEKGDGIELDLEYASDLFMPRPAERLLERFAVLARQATSSPDAPIATLETMTSAEKERVVVTWNLTELPFDAAPIHEQVERRARRTPDAIAVVSEASTLTYAELERRASLVASGLARRGVRRGDRVGTWFPRSVEMVVADLAVWKAGAAFVPLDPVQPLARAALITADAGLRLVLATGDFALRGDVGAEVTTLDALAGSGVEPSVTTTHPRDAAYVIYTSGTTGQPKGVVVEHRSLANLVSEHVRLVGLTSSDRASQILNPAFDGSMNEIWPALAVGSTLHIVDEEVRLSPKDLVAWMNEHGVTVGALPTSLLEALFVEDLAGCSLRVVTTGGQALRQRPRPDTPFDVVNVYGPTEATDYVTSELVTPGSHAVTTIGSPIQNTSIYILDGELAPAPIGVVGEICVGGVNVGRGYLGRPALTAERFIPDAFGAEPGRRLYRTGDRGRWRDDGRIEFAGRSDDQVKIRGFRIELGEIETALRAAPGVRDAVVVAADDATGDKRLVAYVVTSDGAQRDPKAVGAALGGVLPDYMVPRRWVFLDALPLTANGKVDRRALPAPELPTSTSEYVAPRSPLERELAAIWSGILGVPRIGVHDDFFALGGHSLRVTQLVARIRDLLGVEVPVRAIFESPTIAGIVEYLVDVSATSSSDADLEAALDEIAAVSDKTDLGS